MNRCFISINLPEECKTEIIRIQKELEKKNLFTGKLTEAENLHLTLKFLGEIDADKEEKVKEKLKEINFKEFTAELGEVGVFSEDYIRILWIKLENCDLLQKAIDERLKDLFPKEDRFMSHITLARVKSIRDKKELLESRKRIKYEKISFRVDEFYLMKSDLSGKVPVYNIIEKYTLR